MRIVLSLLLLLTVAPGLRAQEITRPEQDPDYAAMPLETEEHVECDRVWALITHTRAPDVMLFGSAGFSGSISGPSRTVRTFRFPLADDIFAAALSSDDALLYVAGTDGIVRQFRRGSPDLQRSYPEDALWADRTIRPAASTLVTHPGAARITTPAITVINRIIACLSKGWPATFHSHKLTHDRPVR